MATPGPSFTKSPQQKGIFLTCVGFGSQMQIGSMSEAIMLSSNGREGGAMIINLAEVIKRVYTPPPRRGFSEDCETLKRALWDAQNHLEECMRRADGGEFTGEDDAWKDPNLAALGVAVGCIIDFGKSVLHTARRQGTVVAGLEALLLRPFFITPDVNLRVSREIDQVQIREPTGQKPMDLSTLREAIKAVPAMKYALAVLAVFSVVGSIALLQINAAVAAVAFVLLLIAMVSLVVFARLVQLSPKHLLRPAQILLWLAVTLFAVVAILLVTSAFFDRPAKLRHWLEGAAATSNQ
jgi:hypothetical protein